MEVYVLDSLLRRNTVVDVFESLIWTERFTAYGDFELVLRSTPASRNLFKTGTRFVINESYRVMTVETVEDSTNSDGKAMLKLKGRSLEAVLEDRPAVESWANLKDQPKWILNDTPKAVMDTMFDHIVRSHTLNAGDGIPFLQPGSIFPADTLISSVDPITWNQDPDTLYNALKAVGELYGLGFRLLRNFDLSQLYFDVYAGIDRTTGQTVVPPVVFSPDLENLQDTTELTSIDKAKNVAYVFSEQGFQVVYAQDVDSTISGFDRQILVVKADTLADVDNVAPTPAQITAHLIQAGREGLADNQGYSAFDGEISQYSQFKYGTHYNLGDMVEKRNVDGVATNMRVTEQIFASDNEGDRSYPTLTVYEYITPGSWLSWEYNQTWADLDDNPITWGELP